MAASLKTESGAEFEYPVKPDPLEIFTRYGLLEKPKTPAVEYLSLLISKTSLETRKLTHGQIQEFGENVYQRKINKYEREKEIAVFQAVEETQKRADERLQKELASAAQKAAEEKEAALQSLKSYYENLSERVDANRTGLERERTEKLIIRKDEEKAQALAEQWNEAERLKAEAIERVLTVQKRELRAMAALQREKAIADALRAAREKFKDKLEDEIKKTKRYCEKIMQDEIRKQQDLHQVEVVRLRDRIVAVERQLQVQMEKMRNAQRDYWEMENEYCNFLDYTAKADDCPSGFLLTTRKRLHGKGNANKDQNVQTRLISLDQGTKTVQTDIKFRIQ